MAAYQYVTTPDALKRFLTQIPGSGTPSQLTAKELEARGFRSHNHRAIIGVLKFIGMLDSEGRPTESYRQYKDRAQGPAVLAAAIRTGYADLFATYPDAFNKDNEALRNFFSTHSEGGQKVQDSIVGTFKALCSLADFQAEPVEIQAEPPTGAGRAPAPRGPPPPPPPPSAPGLVINVNIQLALPPTENAEVYDKIFAALKKNLM